MQFWLSEYFEPEGTVSNIGFRTGAIQSALNIEIDGKCQNIAKMIIMPEGINGLQPNLDFVNLIIRLMSYRSIPTSLNDYVEPRDDSYRGKLINVLHMMSKLAFGFPASNHGQFLKYEILIF